VFKSYTAKVTVTLFNLEKYNIQFLVGVWIFLFATMFRLALRATHPPIEWLLGDLFLVIKQPGHAYLSAGCLHGIMLN
jgi:hypothetical protein